MLNVIATETPSRVPRFVSALLVAVLAFAPLVVAPLGFARLVQPEATPCAVSVSENRPRATIRTRTHALNARYMLRRHCAHDSAGRIHCAR